jgi:hypothetical protein
LLISSLLLADLFNMAKGRYKTYRTPRQRQIIELLAEGYSADAIACRLGISHKTVNWYLSRIEVRKQYIPPGFITLAQAADKVGLPVGLLHKGIGFNDLKYVWFGSQRYTKLKWVRIWIDSLNYRRRANTMVSRLFAGRSKPAE